MPSKRYSVRSQKKGVRKNSRSLRKMKGGMEHVLVSVSGALRAESKQLTASSISTSDNIYFTIEALTTTMPDSKLTALTSIDAATENKPY